MTMISDFDDRCFVLASHNIRKFILDTNKIITKKLTIHEFADLLYWGLQSAGDDLIGDINISNIETIKILIKKKKKVNLVPGDIVAIPSSSDKNYHFLVYLTSNTFGAAYGISRGRFTIKPLKEGWKPDAFRYPIYSGKRFVADGSWPIIGNYPYLLELFTGEPELYHYPNQHIEHDDIGAYGSAEKPSGIIRYLSKKESIEIEEFYEKNQTINEFTIVDWLDRKNI